MKESYKNDKVKSPDGINSSDKELLIELYSQFNKKNKKREKAGKSKISGEQYFEKLINKHDWKKTKKSMTIMRKRSQNMHLQDPEFLLLEFMTERLTENL